MKIVPASQIVFGTDDPYRTCVEHVPNLKAMALPASTIKAIERDDAVRMVPRLA